MNVSTLRGSRALRDYLNCRRIQLGLSCNMLQRKMRYSSIDPILGFFDANSTNPLYMNTVFSFLNQLGLTLKVDSVKITRTDQYSNLIRGIVETEFIDGVVEVAQFIAATPPLYLIDSNVKRVRSLIYNLLNNNTLSWDSLMEISLGLRMDVELVRSNKVFYTEPLPIPTTLKP